MSLSEPEFSIKKSTKLLRELVSDHREACAFAEVFCWLKEGNLPKVNMDKMLAKILFGNYKNAFTHTGSSEHSNNNPRGWVTESNTALAVALNPDYTPKFLSGREVRRF